MLPRHWWMLELGGSQNIDGKDAVMLASDEGHTEIESYIRKKISHSAKTAVSVEL